MPPRDYDNLLIQKLANLEEKVDRLGQDRATRSDIEALRKELVGSFVPRDAYEPRHAALVERDLAIETMVRELRKDAAEEAKALRLDMTQDIRDLGGKIKQQQDAQLSSKDRAWLRGSQLLGVAGIVFAVLDWLSQHLKF